MPDPLTRDQIKSLRIRLGLTQPEFADLLNDAVPGLRTHKGTVSRWENGHLPPSLIAANVIRRLMETNL